ncbi:sensor histidine kinase [Actinoplanes sp. NPDC049265]|uniref:sensor histidine kinase n=1 Tax=Actinoplanes sp. NPDC049265 TaxID=3363902 RepID=UPI003711E34C
MSRWANVPIRLRTALAATAAAAICFGAGALWLRHELYANRLQASVAQARSEVNGLALAHASGNAGLMGPYRETRWFRSGLNGPTPHSTTDTYVRADVWTGPDGRVTQSPPYLREADGTTRIVPAVARTRVSYYLLVSPAEAEAATRAADPLLLVALPVGIAVVAAVAWFAAGRALRPVDAISGELRAITSASLDRRVPVPSTGDEIEALARTTNATLDRLAQAADRQRRFVADAAHELRSPLAGLRSTVEVARAHTEPAALPAVLDVVLTSARRLQDLTDDLLLLARLDGAGAGPGQPVDLAATAEEQIAERQLAGDGRVTFTLAAASAPAVVTGDRLQLERLLRNLLDNAARHARGTVLVRVTAGDGTVVTEVVDDGDGIDPADRDRIFQPFTRLDDARARDSGGTGLGLAIVRDIAARHHGRVEVGNGPGAHFTVVLPAAAATG